MEAFIQVVVEDIVIQENTPPVEVTIPILLPRWANLRLTIFHKDETTLEIHHLVMGQPQGVAWLNTNNLMYKLHHAVISFIILHLQFLSILLLHILTLFHTHHYSTGNKTRDTWMYIFNFDTN